MCLNYPEIIPPSPVGRKIVFYKTGPSCQKDWELLFYTTLRGCNYRERGGPRSLYCIPTVVLYRRLLLIIPHSREEMLSYFSLLPKGSE